MKKIVLATMLFSLSLIAKAQHHHNKKILGVWWNEERTSRIEVYEHHDKIYGKIVWLKDNTNPDGSTPRTDYKNPDEKMQKKPLIGQQILKHLYWDKYDKEWEDGEIYDPKSGKTYSCYAELQDDGKLFLKGYVLGMPFLGRSTLWTRYDGD